MTDGELWQKRAEALRKLDEYIGWHWPNPSDPTKLLIAGLTRDIMTGDLKEVERLSGIFDGFNQTAMLKRLARA